MSTATMIALVRENEQLRAENAQMRSLLRVEPSVEFVQRAKRKLAVMPQVARILWSLWDCKPKSKDAIFHSVWGDLLNPPEIKAIDVQMCRLRAAIAPHGATIITIWGHGYHLRPEDRDIVAAAIGIEAKP